MEASLIKHRKKVSNFTTTPWRFFSSAKARRFNKLYHCTQIVIFLKYDYNSPLVEFESVAYHPTKRNQNNRAHRKGDVRKGLKMLMVNDNRSKVYQENGFNG